MVGQLLINPPDDVATGNVPNEQEQAVRGLVQPAVPEAMPGQRAIAELVRLGTRLESLMVPAVGECPIPLQPVAAWFGAEGAFNFCPRHVAMPVDVPFGYGVGDSLKAEHPHQPIEDQCGVMGFDGRDYSKKERALRERGTEPSPFRKRPLILHIEETEAPQATCFSNAQIEDLRIAEKSLMWIRQHC
jgi:hypothetical protein